MSAWTVGLEQLRHEVECGGELGAAADRWDQAGSAGRQTGDAAAAQANKLDAAWSGGGAEAVLAYTKQLCLAFDALPGAGSAVAGALRGVESALHHAHDVISRLIADVDAAVAALPQPVGTPEWVAAVAGVVGPAQTQARAVVDDAEHALTTATRTITGAATDTPFTDLAPIADQAFEPARFDPVQWSPQQVAQTGSQAMRPPPGAAASGGDPGGGGPGGGGAGSGDGGGGQGHGGGAGGSGDGGGGGGSGAGGGSGSGGGGLGASGGPPGGGGGATAAPAQVKAWIDEAMAIMKAAGVDTSKLNPDDVWAMISHESAGDPHAINLWDSNYEAGHPSKGLMQCIDSTFDANKLPGHSDIWNPVDNIIAGCRYSIARYGSTADVPGIAAMSSGGAYQGY